MTDNGGNDVKNRKKVGLSWVGKHHLITTHDGRRRQRTVRYQTPSPRPKFRVVQGLKFIVERTGKFKRMLIFLFVDKEKLCAAEIVLRRIQTCFLSGGAWLVLKICNQGSKVFEEFSATSGTLWSWKLHF